MKKPWIVIDGSEDVEMTGNTFEGKSAPTVQVDGTTVTMGCPKCGSKNVSGGSVKLISGVLTVSGGTCRDCGHTNANTMRTTSGQAQ